MLCFEYNNEFDGILQRVTVQKVNWSIGVIWMRLLWKHLPKTRIFVSTSFLIRFNHVKSAFFGLLCLWKMLKSILWPYVALSLISFYTHLLLIPRMIIGRIILGGILDNGPRHKSARWSFSWPQTCEMRFVWRFYENASECEWIWNIGKIIIFQKNLQIVIWWRDQRNEK